MNPPLTSDGRLQPATSVSPTTGFRAPVVLGESLLVIAAVIAVYLYVGTASRELTLASIMQLAWINNFVLATQLVLLRKSFGSWFAPFVIYALFLSLFTSGQLILFSLGVEPSGADVINREAAPSVARATAFYITAFSIFCAAAVVTNEFKRARTQANKAPLISTDGWQDALRSVGLGCALIGIVPFAVQNAYNVSFVLERGYSRYYDEGSRIENPFLSLGYLFITGLIMLACCGRKRLRILATVALLLISSLRLISGDRGEGIIYVLTAFLLTSIFSAVTRRRIIWAGAAAVFAILVIPAIGSLRRSYGQDLAGLGDLWADKPLQATLTTMGITLFPLVAVINLVDSGVPTLMGTSYISAVVRVLPDAVLAGPLLDVMRNLASSSPATWLMHQFGLSYGPGFTPFAEAYLNFGWWGGCAAIAAYGVAFALLLRLPASTQDADLLRIALVVTAFALVGFSVRGSANFVFPYLVRYVAIPGVLVVLLARRRHQERRRAEGRHD